LFGITLLNSLGNRESPDGFSNKGGASIGVGGKGVLGLLSSLTLAQSASVAGGLKSRGNNSRPAWVSLGQDWSMQGISITLANWMCKGTYAIVMNAKGSVGTGLADEATGSQTKGISVTLAQALWGPVAVGGTSWVEAGTAKRSIKAIAKERLSVTLAQALWGPVAVGSTSWVDTGSAKSSVWAIAKEWLSVTLAQALRGPVAIGGTSWVEPGSAKSSVWAIAKERLSVTLSKALWGPVAVGGTSWVEAGSAKSTVCAIAKEWLSFTLAEALRGPVAVGGTGRVEAGTTQSTVRTISIKWVGSGQCQKR